MSTADAIALGANIGTLLLILSGIAVGVLRRYQRFRDFVLLRPLRRAVGELPEVDAQSLTAQFMVSENETSTGLRGPPLIARLGRWPRIVSWLRAIEQERMIQRRLKAPVLEALGRRSIAPGHIVAEVCAGPGAATWDITAPVLAKIFHTIRQSPEPLLARILYPYEAQHLIQVVDRIDEYLHRFVKCKALDDVRQGSPVTQRESFGAFAIALTGAIVLADAAETKERHAKEALIWHSRDFRSGQSMSDAASEHLRYDDAHPGAQACNLWAKLQRGADKARPGEYDLRLLDLRTVTLAEAVTEGYLAFVLETAETCYATTEDGTCGCKNVRPAPKVEGDDGFAWAPVRDHGGFRVGRQFAGPRVALLDVQVAVVSSDKKLLFANRTKDVRHGREVCSITAGGPIKPASRRGGDVDEFGSPDPARAITREAKEEIGAHLEPHACAPVCVFICNVRGRSEINRNDGQLVANVLYIAHLQEEAARIEEAAWSSSDVFFGRFEQQGLVACEFDSPAKIAGWCAENATKLDQHGIVSCLYACSAEYGYREARDAFEQAFSTKPWWAISPYQDSAVRLTRDPSALIKDASWLPETGPAQWRPYWNTDAMIF